MKKRITVINVLALFLMQLFVMSCSNLIEGNIKNPTQEKGKATIMLRINSLGRTVLPEEIEISDLDDLILEGEMNGEIVNRFKKTFSSLETATDTAIIVEPGSWNFTLIAHKGNIVFRGILSNVVIEEGSNTLQFQLELYSLGDNSNTGTVSITINFPEENGIRGVKAGLFNIEDDNEISGFPLRSLRVRNNSITYTVNSVPVGNYRFKAFLYADDALCAIINTYREIVVVADGLVSSAERTLNNLNEVYRITYNENGGSFVNTYITPENFSRNSDILLATAENIHKEGFAFAGWYEEPDFSGQRITRISKNTIGDKSLYAKWVQGCVVTSSTLSSLDLSEVEEGYSVVAVGHLNLLSLANKIKEANNHIVLDLFACNIIKLDKRVFSDCEMLSGIVFPETITTIGEESFYNCTGLTSVTIPDKVSSIENNPFGNCISLSVINVSQSNPAYRSIDGVLYTKDGRTLVQYPAGKNDNSYSIPEGTTSISNHAFVGNNSIQSITINEELSDIAKDAFDNCSNILEYNVANGNRFYIADAYSHILYSYDEQVLIRYPTGKESSTFLLPAWIVEIDDHAFYGCNHLSIIQVPNESELTRIGSYAFYGCSSLGTFVIPNSVSLVGGHAFDNCNGDFNYYSITFETNGGTAINSVSVKNGEYVQAPSPAPTKTGYIFDGWYSTSNYSNLFLFSETVTSNKIAYAKWIPVEYRITYNLNDGINSSENQSSYTIISPTFTLSNATKAGYRFDGWYNSSDFSGERITSIPTGSIGNIILYAKYTPISGISYSVNHYWQNITGNEYTLHETEDRIGTTESFTDARTRTYTGFNARSFEQQRIAGNGSTVVNIYYDRKIITFTLNLAGGTLSTPLTNGRLQGRYGAAVSVETPQKIGFQFLGWNTIGGTLPSTFVSDASYIALFNPSYTVRHYWQNITGDEYTLHETEQKFGNAGAVTSAQRKVYTGFNSRSFTQKTIESDGSTVVDIYYDRQIITLSFDLDGGTLSTPLTDGRLQGRYGATVSVETPTKSGYSFVGWNTNGGTLPSTFSSDASYTALWTVPLPPTISRTSSGTYRFNESSGYWISNNNGINSSTASSTWTFTVNSACTLSIYYQVSSESNYDKFTLKIDNANVLTDISGTVSNTITRYFTSGTHTITATYSKDLSEHRGSDNVKLRFSFTAGY